MKQSLISRWERSQPAGCGRDGMSFYSGTEVKSIVCKSWTPLHPYDPAPCTVGLTEPNQQSFQIALNRPERDKSNWSPCHRSLSLTASCHSNKLHCCRMRPINCDVGRACQVPCARCNCEHQWFLGFAGALYQNAILHLSWFVNAYQKECESIFFTFTFSLFLSWQKRVMSYFGTSVFLFKLNVLDQSWEWTPPL